MTKIQAFTCTAWFCCSLTVFAGLFSEENTPAAGTNPVVRLTLDLKDGSRVEGRPVNLKWPLHSELVGSLKLELTQIASLEAAKTNGWTVNFRNGDRLKATVELAQIELKTSFGQVSIAPDLIRAIRVAAAGAGRPALKFNRSNRVEIPNDPELQFGDGPFTISFWFKTDSDLSSLNFIAKRENAYGDGWVVNQENGQLLFYCAGCASPKSQPVSIRDGQWHQMIIARAGSLIQFYLDGKDVGSGGTQCNHFDNHPLRIGMDADNNSWHFDGELSEVHIYRRTLTRDEVAEEWNNGQGLVGAVAGGGLIAGYHFDEGQGGTAKDFSGHHHDGMLINRPEWTH